MARKIIGLDIGYDAIMAVYIKGKPSNFQLAGCWREPLPDDPDSVWSERALSAIKKIKKKFPKGKYTLVTALNRAETMLHNLSFPFSDFQKIYKVARFDVEPYLPFPIDQVLLDIYVLDMQDNSAEVMVVGAPIQTIEERLGLLKAANLNPDVITLDALGLATASYHLRKKTEVRPLIILDIGVKHSTLNVVTGDKLHYSRSIDFGETEIIEKLDSCDLKESEQTIKELCLPLLKEINFSLQSWGLKRQDNGPVEVSLNGAVSKLPGFMEALSDGLKIPVVKLNLFHSDLNVETANGSSAEITLFNNALALAWVEMKGDEAASVNFLKEKQLSEGRTNKMRQTIVATSLIAGFIIIFGGIDLYVRATLAEKQVKQVKDHIIREFKQISPKTKRIVNPYQQLTTQVDKLKNKNSLLKKLLNRRSSGLGILRDLSELIPQEVEVQLNDFLVDRDDIQIGGETPFFEQIETLQKLINDSPKFSDVEVLESSSSQKGDQVRFKIRMKLVESE